MGLEICHIIIKQLKIVLTNNYNVKIYKINKSYSKCKLYTVNSYKAK